MQQAESLIAVSGALSGIMAVKMIRGRMVVRQWVRKNGFRLIYVRPSLLRGAVYWESTPNQQVYRVTAEVLPGDIRSAWLICGDSTWGLLSGAVEAKWDEE